MYLPYVAGVWAVKIPLVKGLGGILLLTPPAAKHLRKYPMKRLGEKLRPKARIHKNHKLIRHVGLEVGRHQRSVKETVFLEDHAGLGNPPCNPLIGR